MATSPLCIHYRENEILTFHFQTLPLFELDAQSFVRQHQTCMYPLLVTMRGVHAKLVEQAMKKLSDLHRNDKHTLTQLFIWMKLLLDRTEIIPKVEKQKIRDRLHMFDQLWEESPTVHKMREEYSIQGLQEGRQEGHQEGIQKGVIALQNLSVSIIRTRFPELADYAQQKVHCLNKLDVLQLFSSKSGDCSGRCKGSFAA